MMKTVLAVGFGLLFAASAVAVAGQDPAGSTLPPVYAPAQEQGVPRTVAYVGTVTDVFGQPRPGPATLTFGIYADQDGGYPLWLETQSVLADERGRYSVSLGAVSGGLPLVLFQSAEARWLGVQVDGLFEQTRVRLISVPYALKAADAETLDGYPLSAFLLSDGARRVDGRRPLGLPVFGAGGTPLTGPPDSDGSDEALASTGAGDIPSPEVVLTNGDGIIRNSLCVGFDCPDAPVFDDSTILLMENNARIKFGDTSNAPFPNNDWEIEANSNLSGGDSYLGFNDCGTVDNDGGCANDLVFAVESGTRANALYVENDGDVGLGTSNPVLDLHIVTGNTPSMRLDQDGSSGFAPQVWDIAGNETNFFIRDVTGGSQLPLRIRPGAPTSSIDIAASGDVGIGTAAPVVKLDVNGYVAAGSLKGYVFRDDLNTGMVASAADTLALVTNGATRLAVVKTGNVGIGVAAPVVKLDVDGFVAAGSLKGYVFRDDLNTGMVASAADTLALVTNGATRLAVGATGNVGVGTTTPGHPLHMASGAHVTSGGVWTDASSRALKHDIRPLDARDALQTLTDLLPVRYAYNANPSESHVGFIAEDVPALVASTDRKGVAAMDIVAVLTKVVQEQQQLIESLKARIDALEAVQGR